MGQAGEAGLAETLRAVRACRAAVDSRRSMTMLPMGGDPKSMLFQAKSSLLRERLLRLVGTRQVRVIALLVDRVAQLRPECYSCLDLASVQVEAPAGRPRD